jgi:hypothetical protein
MEGREGGEQWRRWAREREWKRERALAVAARC